MQRFIRLIGGVIFSVGLALSTTAHASATGIDIGGTMVEFDQNAPMIAYAKVRTVIRNLPVRF